MAAQPGLEVLIGKLLEILEKDSKTYDAVLKRLYAHRSANGNRDSNMPDLEPVNNASTVTATSTGEISNTGASSSPAPVAEEPVSEPNGNNMRKMFGNNANAFAAETPAPAAPAEPQFGNSENDFEPLRRNSALAGAAPAPSSAPAAPEEPVAEPNGNNMRKMFGNNANAFAAETPAPETPVTNNNMSSNPAFSQFAANSFGNQAVTPVAEEPVSEPNGNNMRKMFGNDSNAFAAETPAPETPAPAAAPAASPIPEGWEKEEFEQYEKLSEAQKKTYDEIRPTIGLNNSVKTWKNVMDVAKGVEKKKKQKGGAKTKARSVTPIGKRIDISLKKSKKTKKSKSSKTSKSPKKSRKSKA